MEKKIKLPKKFFEKARPVASNDSLNDVLPFKFTNDDEVKQGKRKNKKIINLVK